MISLRTRSVVVMLAVEGDAREKSVDEMSVGEVQKKRRKSAAKKALLAVAGSVSLAVGVIGIVVPVLPTTPFLLLAAFCYLRSSRRLYDWLMSNRVLGPYIYNYMNYRAVSRGTKIWTLMFLWAALTVSILVVPNLYVRLFLVAVGVGVSIHLFALKTMAKENPGGTFDEHDSELEA